MLATVEADGISLDVPGMGDRHHHVFLGNQIFNLDVRRGLHDLGTPLVSIGVPDRDQLLFDHIQSALTRQDRLQID